MNIRYHKGFKFTRRVIKHILSSMYPIVKNLIGLPRIQSIEETIAKIIEEKCSISRFGDGEFLYIVDKLNLPFQEQNEELRFRLIEVLKSDDPKILIGLPNAYRTVANLNKEARLTWQSQIVWVYPRLRKYLRLKGIYYNSNISRPYADYEDKSQAQIYFDQVKEIWKQKPILLVEGEKSRLGVGNDLFSNALSIERIISPKHHAFTKFNEIVDEIKTHEKSKIVLIALGPTATVMAYDVSKLGYQALDIGNIDIEYEWFLQNAKEKTKIKGKYTSEAIGGREVEEIEDPFYYSQIIRSFA